MRNESNSALDSFADDNDEEDDDFTDFASAVPSSSNNSNSHAFESSFSDHISNVTEQQQKFDTSSDLCIDDEFADFSDFQQSLPASTHHQSAREETKLETLMNETFANNIEQLDEVLIANDFYADKSALSYNIWKQLQNLEETPSLKLKWQTSHSFQTFLSSMKIDPRNILQNAYVPIFASGLGLLEPVKSVNQPSSDNSTPELAAKSSSSETFSCPSIPPVNFDWNSSGLTNPLDTSSLDLDFFVSKDATVNENKASLISSLEEELLKPEPQERGEPKSNLSMQSNDTLHQLNLHQLYSSSSGLLHKRPASLSREANQILDELPVLSFIRAKVLMFPVNDECASGKY